MFPPRFVALTLPEPQQLWAGAFVAVSGGTQWGPAPAPQSPPAAGAQQRWGQVPRVSWVGVCQAGADFRQDCFHLAAGASAPGLGISLTPPSLFPSHPGTGHPLTSPSPPLPPPHQVLVDHPHNPRGSKSSDGVAKQTPIFDGLAPQGRCATHWLSVSHPPLAHTEDNSLLLLPTNGVTPLLSARGLHTCIPLEEGS